MSNNQTIKGKNLNSELVTVSEKPSVMDSGAKYVYVGYNNKNLVVQTPEMDIPFGLNTYDKGEYPKYSVDLSFKGVENNKSMKTFYDNLNKMDEKLIGEGVKQSLNWFKKKSMKRDVVESLFNRTIKIPVDKNTGEPTPYPHRLKLKIPYKDNKCQTVFYNKEGEQLNEDVSKILVRGAQAKVVMQCVGLWISSSSYMCQWKAVRMEVQIPEGSGDTDFLPDTDDEEAETASESPKSKSKENSKDKSKTKSKENTMTQQADSEDNKENSDDSDGSDDSDDSNDSDDSEDSEDSDESDEEPEPEPEPVKKKKSGSKAKKSKK